MGEWQKVERKPYSPCDSCQTGYGGISQKVVEGVLYQKSDDCSETCERLREHIQEAVDFFRKPRVDISYVLTTSGYKKKTFI